MKLIRWVEVHIGRSKRKTKKDKDGLSIHCGADIPRRRDESTPCTPLHKVEPLGKHLPGPRSAGNTPRRTKHPPSPHPSLRVPETPGGGGRSGRRSLQIRTSFLDPCPVPLSAAGPQQQAVGFGSATTLDSGSPRVRCRIKTNPWLPSPRCSSWGLRSSSIGSESTESIAGSAFGGQSSGSLWEGYCGEPWSTFRAGPGRSPSVNRLPRVTLERSTVHKQRLTDRTEPDCLSYGEVEDEEDRPYCPVTYCRPIPRSAWMDFRELTASTDDVIKMRLQSQDDQESSDEAYSEDYVHSEEQDELPLEVIRASEGRPPDTGSPQADSACGSDRDNSSCSTTPISETPAPEKQRIVDTPETLRDKVARLRLERRNVDRRMQEARAEEILRREETLLLQRELVQFRRLLLLQTLAELRDQLERRGKRRRVKCYASSADDSGAKAEDEDDSWLQVPAELLG